MLDWARNAGKWVWQNVFNVIFASIFLIWVTAQSTQVDYRYDRIDAFLNDNKYMKERMDTLSEQVFHARWDNKECRMELQTCRAANQRCGMGDMR